MKRRAISLLLALVLVLGLLPVTVLAVTDSEPNDTLGQAQSFTPGDTIDGLISVKGDYDWYKFTLTESGRISLTMKAYMQYYTLHIFNTDGENLWYTDENTWNSSVGFRKDTHDIDLTEGTYYLRVTGDYFIGSSGRSTGNYTLNTSFTGANATETEDNNSIANANPVALNGTIHGQIASNDRNDYHQFTLTESGRLSLEMTAYLKYYTLHIYNTSGENLWYTDENTWNSSVGFRKDTHDIDLTEGTYYLRVTGDYFIGSSGRSTGNYTLNTSFTGANVTETESNNSFAEANYTVLNVPIHGQIAVNDRNDYHQFTLTKPGRITLTMTSYMQYYTLNLYDEDGTDLWNRDEKKWNSSVGFRSDIYTIELTAGTYYLRVTGDYFIGSSGRSTGSYKILLNTPNPFTDTHSDDFYYNPVLWAVENGITTGATADSFNPNGSCLRAHVVTFLHRAEKNPNPTSTRNPFTDVKNTDFFYKPVLWAVEKGITNGVSGTKFGSYDVCNRAAVVTFLWRAAGSPEPESTSHPFTDVKPGDFFYKSVLWAVEKGITNGVDATHFGPTSPCNRAQVVTFLYRACS